MIRETLNIIFAGTPPFAADHLNLLINSNHQVTAVLTRPDKPSGRGQKTSASAVKQIALANNLPVYQPETLKNESVQTQIKQLAPDVIIVVAYGLILPPEVLTIPSYGCINVHASLLPRWRGASPIQSAILAGDYETGVSIMQMEEGLDTGPVYLQKTCPIYATDTAGDLEKKLATLGGSALLEVLSGLMNDNNVVLQQQNAEGMTYAKKIDKTQAKINWQLSAQEIDRQIRAFNPQPTAFTTIGNETVRIWQATPLNNYVSEPAGTILRLEKSGIDVATGDGTLRLHILQFAGGNPLLAEQVINSKKNWFLEQKKFL